MHTFQREKRHRDLNLQLLTDHFPLGCYTSTLGYIITFIKSFQPISSSDWLSFTCLSDKHEPLQLQMLPDHWLTALMVATCNKTKTAPSSENTCILNFVSGESHSL